MKTKEKRIAAVTIAILLVVTVAAVGVSSTTIVIQSAEAFIDPVIGGRAERPKAPAVVSGDNIYIVWWTDRGTVNTNGEVMFRASTDGGATFGDRINLSNTDTADSIDAEISAEGENVIVSWWEHNQTSDIPVARVSNDGGATFGPILTLAANGTLSSTEEETTTTTTAAEEEEGGA
jgi:hypothetical protein